MLKTINTQLRGKPMKHLSLAIIFFLVWSSNLDLLPRGKFNMPAISQAQPFPERMPRNRRSSPVDKFYQLLELRQSQGHDVSKAQELNNQAIEAMRAGNRQEARRLLAQAIDLLENMGTENTGENTLLPTQGESKGDLVLKVLLSSPQARLTYAIPNSSSGQDIRSGSSDLFTTQIMDTENSTLNVSLSSTPLYIEEYDPSKAPSSTNDLNLRDFFGISYAGFIKDPGMALNFVKELGAGWVRFLGPWGGLVWDLQEPVKGTFEWSSTDHRFNTADKLGLKIMVNLYSINSWDQPDLELTQSRGERVTRLPAHYPNDLEEYLKFVKTAAERYDGDGYNDAPSSPVVSTWIIGTEMESETRWQDTPENYARLFVETYKAIKEVSPEAQVIFYGSNIYLNQRSGELESFTIPALKEVKRLTQDMKDFSMTFAVHHYRSDPRLLINILSDTREMLNNCGWTNVPIWVTDCATFNTEGVSQGEGNLRSEEDLAEDLVKLVTTGLAYGVQRFVWAQLSDGHLGQDTIEGGFIGKASSYSKEIYKKLSFYAYQHLLQKIGNVDPADVQILHNGDDNIYAYSFRRLDGNKVIVAWAKQ